MDFGKLASIALFFISQFSHLVLADIKIVDAQENTSSEINICYQKEVAIDGYMRGNLIGHCQRDVDLNNMYLSLSLIRDSQSKPVKIDNFAQVKKVEKIGEKNGKIFLLVRKDKIGEELESISEKRVLSITLEDVESNRFKIIDFIYKKRVPANKR